MAFTVNKVQAGINCPGLLVLAINANVTITTICLDVTIDDGDQLRFTFFGTGPLSPVEDSALDSLLSTFSCPSIVFVKLGDEIGIQNDGSSIPETPHHTLNFDSGLNAVNDGNGRATITVSGGTTLTIKDESVDVPNTPHTAINFLGTGVAVADGGSGVANITITQSSLTIKDESTTVPNTPHMTLNFIGTPVTVTDGGGGEALITIDDPALTIKDQSINVANTPHTSLNFLGAGVSVVDAGSGVANVTIPGGGGGSPVTFQDEGIGLPGAPHTTLNFVGGVTATDSGGGVATVTVPVFGTEFQRVISSPVTTTTSIVFQNKITLVTPSIPAGEYRVGFYYSWNHNATDSDFEAEFLEDSSPMGEIHKQEPKDSIGTFGTTGTSQRHVAHKVFFTTLIAGVHTFDLNYRTDVGGDESSIWDAVIEIWRVS